MLYSTTESISLTPTPRKRIGGSEERRIGGSEDRKSGGTTVRSAVLWRRVTGEFLSHRQPLFDIYDSIEVLNLAPNADFDIL